MKAWALTCRNSRSVWLRTIDLTRAGAVRRANEVFPQARAYTLKDWRKKGHVAIRVDITPTPEPSDAER